MIRPFIFLAACVTIGGATAATQSQAQRDVARTAALQKGMADCDARFYHATASTPNRLRTRGEYEACRSAAHDAIPTSEAERGSDRYAESRYGKLSPRQAEDALASLERDYKASIKAGLGKRDARPGEASPTQLEAEAWWIHHHLYDESGKVAGTPWYVPCGGAVDDMTWATQLPGDRQPCPIGSHGVRSAR